MPLNLNIPSPVIGEDNGLTDAQRADYFQRQDQLNENKQERLWQQQQRREGQNLNNIQDDLDFKKYQTGEQAIDSYAQGELQKIYNDALRNHISDDPVQLEGWLQSQVQPLSQWHTTTKGAYKELDSKLQDFNKTYPNIDYNKARDILLNQFENDVLEKDKDGNQIRKNTDRIKFSDYNNIMQSPEFLGATNNDQSAFAKHFYDIPTNPIGDKEYTDKQGRVNSFAWSGQMPQGVGELQRDENGRPSGITLRGDINPAVTDAMGQPMKTLPQDIYDNLAPPAKAAAMGMWYKARPAISENYMKKTGQALTPNIENQLKNAFLYDQARRYVQSDIKTQDVQKEPKPPHININVGGKDVNINDVYGEISNKLSTKQNGVPLNELSATAQKLVLEYANKVADKNFKQADIFIGKDGNGNPAIMEANVEGSKQNPNLALIAPIDFKDINLPANNSTKQKQAILHNQPAQQKKTKEQDPLGIF